MGPALTFIGDVVFILPLGVLSTLSCCPEQVYSNIISAGGKLNWIQSWLCSVFPPQALPPEAHPQLSLPHLHAAGPHLIAGSLRLAAHLVLRGVLVPDG